MTYFYLLEDLGMNYTLNRPLFDGSAPFPAPSTLAHGDRLIAVGTPITGRPPHSTVRDLPGGTWLASSITRRSNPVRPGS